MRSPLKDKPLRNPGQSLDEKIVDIGVNAMGLFMVSGFMVVLSALEWWRAVMNAPPAPIAMTLCAVVVCAICAWRIRKLYVQIQKYKQGREGERIVGQSLEELRSQDAAVFHDIRADNFNIDHVVICQKGIYLIETKTWTKPDKGAATISYDGKVLKKNQQIIDPPPTHQASAAARYLEELLDASTGKRFRVQPILAFPEWYIESKTFSNSFEPWVLNPKGIPKFIQNAKMKLPAEDVNLAAYHLSRHIKTT